MTNSDPYIDDIIKGLDKYEKRVLRFLGKQHISTFSLIKMSKYL